MWSCFVFVGKLLGELLFLSRSLSKGSLHLEYFFEDETFLLSTFFQHSECRKLPHTILERKS